ncbi:hypothetical protein M747DRAFT_250054 [Aspergillus niger ATCC 13496]|uniref:Uncharacterized protein n=3 Tax=Aspergillus niger TaxID=5061 RepID=A2QDC8_ASPNC|nr:hypothetical protein An02g06620 [Aspergillus niger]RDH14204.1 hypothetical protein M747DRAFT_250054 [Aspergillus niger ATCC 13496]CAL00660.1 hypothetical protein An02g06620 [Aspergillus niger]
MYEQMHRYSFPGRSTIPVWYTSSNAIGGGGNKKKAEERDSRGRVAQRAKMHGEDAGQNS